MNEVSTSRANLEAVRRGYPSVSAWARAAGVSRTTLLSRLSRGDDPEGSVLSKSEASAMGVAARRKKAGYRFNRMLAKMAVRRA